MRDQETVPDTFIDMDSMRGVRWDQSMFSPVRTMDGIITRTADTVSAVHERVEFIILTWPVTKKRLLFSFSGLNDTDGTRPAPR